MTKILVTYATMAGSTAEIARAVGEEIGKTGLTVDVLAIKDVTVLDIYDGVVLGAPMIMGFHRDGLRFLRRHRKELQRLPLAVFVTAMSLTRTPDMSLGDIPLTVDEKLPKAPVNPARLTFRERYAQLQRYLEPVLAAVKPAKPVSVAVFGGRLEYGRLKPWAVLFVMLVIQAAARDMRDWDAIRGWAAEVAKRFGGV